MARGRRRITRRGKNNRTPYENRIFNRLGILPSEARARGISLAAARGHAPRRRVIVNELGGEHIVIEREHERRARLKREANEPTPVEHAFLMRQQFRAGSTMSYEDLLPIFMSYSYEKRERIRFHVASAHRRWRAKPYRWRWDIDAPASWGNFPDPKSGEGMLMYYH